MGRSALRRCDGVAIMSLPPQAGIPYLIVSLSLFVLCLIGVVIYEFKVPPETSLPETIMAIGLNQSRLVIGIGAIAYFIVQAAKMTIFIAEEYIKRKRLEREQEQREREQQLRKKVDAEWMEWYQRREAAAKAGKPFDEPTPAEQAQEDVRSK